MKNDLVKLEAAHPADDDLDTGVFKNVADDYIAITDDQLPTIPPIADFNESKEKQALTETQSEVQQQLQNILFLTRPPTFPDDE